MKELIRDRGHTHISLYLQLSFNLRPVKAMSTTFTISSFALPSTQLTYVDITSDYIVAMHNLSLHVID
jgi:hypothetical protein